MGECARVGVVRYPVLHAPDSIGGGYVLCELCTDSLSVGVVGTAECGNAAGDMGDTAGTVGDSDKDKSRKGDAL